MKKILMMLLGLTLHAAAVAEEDVKFVSEDDARMNAAFKKARAGLDEYLKIVTERPQGKSEFAAYVRIDEDDQTEYLWVVDVQKYKDGLWIGAVVSKPALVTKVSEGATIGFEKSDIYDWQYLDEKTGKRPGAFTTCALLTPGNKEDEAFIRDNGLICEF